MASLGTRQTLNLEEKISLLADAWSPGGFLSPQQVNSNVLLLEASWFNRSVFSEGGQDKSPQHQ